MLRMMMILLLAILSASASVAIAREEPANKTVFLVVRDHILEVLVGEDAAVRFEVQSFDGDLSGTTLHFSETPAGVIDPVGDLALASELSFNVTVHGRRAGKAVLNVTVSNETSGDQINVKAAFAIVGIYNSKALKVLSEVVGWTYFVAWSVSFYPQIYENWKRKSVIGLNFDFLSLNVVGFFLYSIFNIGLYAVGPIQRQYFDKHPEGVDPVMLNDVIFSVHAMVACLITIVQCVRYQRGGQTVSRSCRFLHCGIALLLLISLFVAFASALSWLNFLYICSYVKLFITLVKYVPQAYMNYVRKSTMGWSIGNVLLDFTGGSLSIAQMFIISYNNDDWGSIFGDPTKFGLGLFSVLFDVGFILQHYVFYRNNNVPHEQLFNDDIVEEDDIRSFQSND